MDNPKFAWFDNEGCVLDGVVCVDERVRNDRGGLAMGSFVMVEGCIGVEGGA